MSIGLITVILFKNNGRGENELENECEKCIFFLLKEQCS